MNEGMSRETIWLSVERSGNGSSTCAGSGSPSFVKKSRLLAVRIDRLSAAYRKTGQMEKVTQNSGFPLYDLTFGSESESAQRIYENIEYWNRIFGFLIV